VIVKEGVNKQWIKLGPHKWRHCEGFIIARYWALGIKKKYYFSCFRDEDLYYKGINEISFSSLVEAKDYFLGSIQTT